MFIECTLFKCMNLIPCRNFPISVHVKNKQQILQIESVIVLSGNPELNHFLFV